MRDEVLLVVRSSEANLHIKLTPSLLLNPERWVLEYYRSRLALAVVIQYVALIVRALPVVRIGIKAGYKDHRSSEGK
jgi:hypothetical protein